MSKDARYIRRLIRGVGRPLDPIPPTPRPGLIRVLRAFTPLYLRLAMGVRSVGVHTDPDVEPGFSGRTILAFRHTSRDDPQVLFHAVLRVFPGCAPVFLYGRGVPVWGGPLVEWLLPRVGAISVYQGQVNKESMVMVRRELTGGTRPLALAPEGQVTYHNYAVSPTQRGAALLALEAAAAGLPVQIVPVGMIYRYPEHQAHRTMRHLRAVENFTNEFPAAASQAASSQAAAQRGRSAPGTDPHAVRERILEAGARLVNAIRAAYGLAAGATDELGDLVAELRRAVFREAERAFALSPAPEMDPLERLFRIRRALYTRLFPPRDTDRRLSRTHLGRTLQAFAAADASLASRHHELADILLYVDFSYLTEPDLPTRNAEYAQILIDLAQRARGLTVGQRPAWPGRSAEVAFGAPLVVPADRGARITRQRVDHLRDRIETRLAALSRPTEYLLQ